MFEVACETTNTCNIDLRFMKAKLARDMARVTEVAPFTASAILPLLQSTAKAVADVGCSDFGQCTFSWLRGNITGDLGGQVSSLSVIQSLLVPQSRAFVNNSTSSSSSSSNGSTTSPPGKNVGATFVVHFGGLVAMLIIAMVWTGI
jgi:mannan endo-1,6-alpha-mannosidase